jgi:hypothetical protein
MPMLLATTAGQEEHDQADGDKTGKEHDEFYYECITAVMIR